MLQEPSLRFRKNKGAVPPQFMSSQTPIHIKQCAATATICPTEMMSNAVVKMLSTVHLNYAARTIFIIRIDLVLFVVAQVKQIMLMLDVVETKHTMLKHKSVVITTVLLRSRILGQKAVVMALIIIETKMCAAHLKY